MKLSEAFEMFMFDKEVAGRYPKTIRTYRDIYKGFERVIGDKQTMELTLQDVQKYIVTTRSKVGSPNTVMTYWRHMKAFIKYMYRNDFIEYDYTVKIPTMKGYKPIKEIYFDDEIQMIFSSIKGNSRSATMKRCIFAILLDTGMRQEEVCKIKLDDINYKQRYIIVHGAKGHADRRVPVSTATIRYINKYLQRRMMPLEGDADLLFCNNEGKPLKEWSIRGYCKTHVKNIGIEKGNTHLFRHTFITRKCLESKDAFYIQQIAGHEDLSTTRKYYHYASSYQVANVSFMPIEQLLATCNY